MIFDGKLTAVPLKKDIKVCPKGCLSAEIGGGDFMLTETCINKIDRLGCWDRDG